MKYNKLSFKLSRAALLSAGLFVASASWAVDAPAPAEKRAIKPVSTAEFVYEYLLAEIAGQRGDLPLSAGLFYDLAERTQNISLAERATRAAVMAREGKLLKDAVSLWANLDPNSLEAQKAATQLLVMDDDIGAAKKYLKIILAQEKLRPEGFLSINNLFEKQKDKAAVAALIKELAADYPSLPEAHLAVAQAAYNAKDFATFKTEAQTALKLRPDWELAALLYGQAQMREGKATGLAYFKDYIKTYPDASEMRLTYAKLLIKDQQFDAAKTQFQALAERYKSNADLNVTLGLLAVQTQDYPLAEKYFKSALALGTKSPDMVYLYLGEMAEKNKQPEQAQNWYEKIAVGSNRYLPAKLAIAQMMTKAGKVDAAIDMLDHVEGLTAEQQIEVVRVEATLLTQANRKQEAFDLLGKAVKNSAADADLLFEYGAAAERVAQYDVMEQAFNKVIAAKPDDATAYNALGYSLADRNVKLNDAKKLIEKALSLAPDDHFILDSMGWVQYRLGNLTEAYTQVKRAFDIQADPEIAAHLGEILWVQGKRDEAKKVWQDALQKAPENDVLKATTKRLAS